MKQKNILNRSDWLAVHLKKEFVPIKGTNGGVFVQEMSAHQRETFSETMKRLTAGETVEDATCKVLCDCVVDADGKPIFNWAEDRELMINLPGYIITELFNTWLRISGITGTAKPKEAKNNLKNQEDSSSSN